MESKEEMICSLRHDGDDDAVIGLVLDLYGNK